LPQLEAFFVGPGSRQLARPRILIFAQDPLPAETPGWHPYGVAWEMHRVIRTLHDARLWVEQIQMRAFDCIASLRDLTRVYAYRHELLFEMWGANVNVMLVHHRWDDVPLRYRQPLYHTWHRGWVIEPPPLDAPPPPAHDA
jgi:hypothetical protein